MADRTDQATLLARIDGLRRQLASVTAERDAARRELNKAVVEIARLLAELSIATVDCKPFSDCNADRIAQAIGDPGSIVGRRLGPSWGEGHEAYQPVEEFVARWATRAVLAVLRQGDGQSMPEQPTVETATVGGGVL